MGQALLRHLAFALFDSLPRIMTENDLIAPYTVVVRCAQRRWGSCPPWLRRQGLSTSCCCRPRRASGAGLGGARCTGYESQYRLVSRKQRC